MPSAGETTPSSKITVRPARSNDATALGVFFNDAWEEAGPGALGFAGATDDAIRAISSEEFLKKRLSSPKVRIIIAEKERKVVGFASIRFVEGHEGELSGVAVLETTSGMGIGSKLVRKACDAAIKLGLAHLSVKTEATNRRAINFYKKNEFTESGKVMEKVGRARVPLMVLRKKLRRHSR